MLWKNLIEDDLKFIYLAYKSEITEFLKLFLYFLIFNVLFIKLLFFNEEIILFWAGLIMFYLFLDIGWFFLNKSLLNQTNSIYFHFLDLLELKLKKLQIYKKICKKQFQIDKSFKKIIINIKFYIYFSNIMQQLYFLGFLNYILFQFLKNLIFEELNFLKIFLNKKVFILNNIDNITFLKINTFFNLKYFFKKFNSSKVNKKILNIYIFILYLQYLKFLKILNLSNNLNYIIYFLNYFQKLKLNLNYFFNINVNLNLFKNFKKINMQVLELNFLNLKI